MRKSIKWLGAIVSILVLLFILTAVCLVTFVNPNRFKPLIAGQVMKYTGRQLMIEGDLSWSLFPYFGIKTGHILLNNPAGFDQKIFAEMQHATIGVKLLPLLNKKIESSGIALDGLKINLIKDANGKNNWQFQPLAMAANATSANRSDNRRMQQFSEGFLIAGIDVTNAEINWTDQQKKQFMSIEKLNLTAKNISFLSPFSVSCDFNFVNKMPALSGHMSITSNVSLSMSQQVFSFRDLILKIKLQQDNKKYNGQLKGDVIADLQQQTLQWTRFSGQFDQLNFTGKIGVANLTTNPHTTGHFQIQPFDVRAFLQSTGQDVANIQALNNLSGEIDFSAAANAVNAQGKFNLDTVEANHVKLTHLVIPVRYQIGVLEMAPITANIYQGSLQSNVKMNLTGNSPQIAVQEQLSNVQLEPLLADLAPNQKLKLKGIANIGLQLTTSGNDPQAVVKNLNGTGQINCKQGVLEGLDIGYLMDTAYSVLKQKALTTQNTKQTTFDSLTGNLVFRDGVIVSDDLLLTAPRFKTNGKGTIDLVNQKIDYHLQTVLLQATQDQKNDWGNLYGMPIPINIAGNLKDPSIRLDTGVLVKAVAEQQIKKIENKAQDQLKQQVQGKAQELFQNLLGH